MQKPVGFIKTEYGDIIRADKIDAIIKIEATTDGDFSNILIEGRKEAISCKGSPDDLFEDVQKCFQKFGVYQTKGAKSENG